jgi:signal peptidase II
VRKAKLRPYLVAAPLAGLVVGVDLLTKRVAAGSFVGSPRVVIPGVLTFTFGENRGAAFSMFQEGGPLLATAAVVAIGVILWALRVPRPGLEVVGLGLIMGGAAGNLIDRLARGEGLVDGLVIDWIQFPNFPIFNIADTSLTVGVALMLLATWRARPTA